MAEGKGRPHPAVPRPGPARQGGGDAQCRDAGGDRRAGAGVVGAVIPALSSNTHNSRHSRGGGNDGGCPVWKEACSCTGRNPVPTVDLGSCLRRSTSCFNPNRTIFRGLGSAPAAAPSPPRSEERRVGKECVST